jgi:hypothetical protein
LKSFCLAIGVWAALAVAAVGCHDNLNGNGGTGGSSPSGKNGGTHGGAGTTGSCGQVLCFAFCSTTPMLGSCSPEGLAICPANTQPTAWCGSGTGGESATGGNGAGGAVGTGGSAATGGTTGGGGAMSGSGGALGTGGAPGTGGASSTGGTTGLGGAGGNHGSAGKGGGGQAGSGTPSQHRPTGTVCSPGLDAGVARSTWDGGTRNPETGADGGAITCTSSSNSCPSCANGLASRCLNGECFCDECNSDQDCPGGGVCSCGLTRGYAGVSQGNVCVPANCRVDSDCGQGGYCSPTVSSGCGAFYGVQGYYCHTPQDQCLNDADCGGSAYCAYSPQAGIWACATGLCAG